MLITSRVAACRPETRSFNLTATDGSAALPETLEVALINGITGEEIGSLTVKVFKRARSTRLSQEAMERFISSTRPAAKSISARKTSTQA